RWSSRRAWSASPSRVQIPPRPLSTPRANGASSFFAPWRPALVVAVGLVGFAESGSNPTAASVDAPCKRGVVVFRPLASARQQTRRLLSQAPCVARSFSTTESRWLGWLDRRARRASARLLAESRWLRRSNRGAWIALAGRGSESRRLGWFDRLTWSSSTGRSARREIGPRRNRWRWLGVSAWNRARDESVRLDRLADRIAAWDGRRRRAFAVDRREIRTARHDGGRRALARSRGLRATATWERNAARPTRRLIRRRSRLSESVARNQRAREQRGEQKRGSRGGSVGLRHAWHGWFLRQKVRTLHRTIGPSTRILRKRRREGGKGQATVALERSR
ncbi:MAG: hypothetical protein RLZZ238_2560, partial [Planctomycetota bacterium]